MPTSNHSKEILIGNCQTQRLLSIMPSRPVRDKWDYQRKMERHFPIKQRQPIGIALATFLSFPNSLIRAKNRFVKNGTANFDRNIPTEISGPPPEVIPNIPVGRNRNGPFHLNSDRNFRNLWHNRKHPESCFVHGIFLSQSLLTSQSLRATIGPLKFSYVIGISGILPYTQECYLTNTPLDHSRFFPPTQYFRTAL